MRERARTGRWLQLGWVLFLVGCAAATTPDGGFDAGTPDAGVPDAGAPDAGLVSIRILSFGDFHGALEPTALSDGGTSGGAAQLAAHVAALRTGASLVVSPGDLIGASPFTSGWFHDEPTVEALNALGLSVSAVGNHELDEGLAELERLQAGGCHPVDGCAPGRSFTGASFEWLSANLQRADAGTRPFAATAIREVGGVRVGFIGITPRETPTLLPGPAAAGLELTDEIDAIIAAAQALEADGVDLRIVLLHPGGYHAGDARSCIGLYGPAATIADAVQGRVAAVISGHTHCAFICRRGDVLVTASGARGAWLTQLDFTVSTSEHLVRDAVADNVEVSSALPPDPSVAAVVAGWDALVTQEKERVVATVSVDIPSLPDPITGESPMADVVADAMLAATRAAPHLAVAALMNRGGIRAPLLYARSGAETVDGQVTLGEAFAVQPFGNELETVTLTGAALVEALDYYADPTRRALQVAGLVYTRRPSAAAGQRVTAADVTIDGAPLEAGRTYRVTVNSIVGSVINTPAMAAATEHTPAGVDLEALLAHLAASSPVGLPVGDRLRVAP